MEECLLIMGLVLVAHCVCNMISLAFAHNNLCSISTSFASQHEYYKYIGLRNQQFKLAILQIAPSTRFPYHLYTHWFKFKKRFQNFSGKDHKIPREPQRQKKIQNNMLSNVNE